MKQGEIWYADLNPSKGREQNGLRPVVILSGDLMNTYMPLVIAAPLTSRIKHYKGNPVLQPDQDNGLQKASEMLVIHIRSLSHDRLVRKLGKITSEELEMAIKTLNDILKY